MNNNIIPILFISVYSKTNIGLILLLLEKNFVLCIYLLYYFIFSKIIISILNIFALINISSSPEKKAFVFMF